MHPSSQRDNLYYFEISALTKVGAVFLLLAARRGAHGARPFCRFATFPHTVGNHPSSQRDNLYYFETNKTPETKEGLGFFVWAAVGIVPYELIQISNLTKIYHN